ncbi:DNA-processing protein DprA [Lysinibacter sp. HNR]|uniref:DNA-processing protein DprA n=1 Tax=Lysinibacter sp. HNR TaxID=3031408 RepID=UPI002436000A|nr:DNA-processing protein DprA [Lysinibacter sp. HNR]WGD38422.1 DNA-processing protein DprA [Lysinibacter sp. HNR]
MGKNIFGLQRSLVYQSVRQLIAHDPVLGVPGEPQDTLLASVEKVAEVFARSVWSRLAEPGDRVSHILIEQLGAAGALNLLLEETEGGKTFGCLDSRGKDKFSGHATALKTGEPTSGTREEESEKSRVDEIRELSVLRTSMERWRPRLVSSEVLRGAEIAQQIGARICTPDFGSWPASLNDLNEHRPHALWIRGQKHRGNAPALSVVGARASTGYGEQVTAEIASGLAAHGVTVVSGGAYGIDGMAHRSALASHGHTVAILAGGIDRLYPSGHGDLFTRILREGTILTEMPPGFSPTKWRFLQRNRLIAALGNATIVCEAGRRSGSLNTAGHAAALGRPLGAVPGPVTSTASDGCHLLLREYNAICVTTAEQAREIVIPLNSDPVVHDSEAHAQSPEYLRLWDALSTRRARSVDELARLSGHSPPEVRALLAELLYEGAIAETSGGWKAVKPSTIRTPRLRNR